MIISIPKIVKKIELKKYAEEFGEASLEVWVNPPLKELEKLRLAKAKVRNLDIPQRVLTPEEKAELERVIQDSYQEQLSVYGELLSQGNEETRLGVDELRQLVESTAETDPQFWAWLQLEIIDAINEHRGTAKKN